MGKSLMMTDLGLAISGGGRFLNVFDVGVSEVLYLCLEDTEQRMQERIKTMQPDCPASGHIHFAFDWDDNEDGALGNLGRWLDSHTNVKIVIIDTISRFSKSLTEGHTQNNMKNLQNSKSLLIRVIF